MNNKLHVEINRIIEANWSLGVCPENTRGTIVAIKKKIDQEQGNKILRAGGLNLCLIHPFPPVLVSASVHFSEGKISQWN